MVRRSRKVRAGSTGELCSPKAAASGRVIHSGIDSAAPCGRVTVKALMPRWTLRAVTDKSQSRPGVEAIMNRHLGMLIRSIMSVSLN